MSTRGSADPVSTSTRDLAFAGTFGLLMADEYTLVPHPEYGFLQISPTPSIEEIEAFYAAEFYSSDYPRLNDSSIEIQTRDRDWYDAWRATMADTIERISGRPLAGQTMLDVGCGWGETLRYFRSRGVGCFGFDPVPEAVEFARQQGIDAVVAGVDRMDVFDGRRFDIITVINVLEHLSQPVDVVKQLREILNPGGVLVIDVPNEFNTFQVAGRETHGLGEWWVVPPAHLNYFSATTIRALLVGEGFDVQAARSSFPLEMFLLFGDNYVVDPELGRQCHERRKTFEANLRASGREEELLRFYELLAEVDLGRQIVVFAQRSADR